jgi:hypothetical protein
MLWRPVLLSFALAAAGAIASSFGQSPEPASRLANGDSSSSASIPNLSGMWAHPFLTGFEPPRSGPGPVRNKSRRPDGDANFGRLVGDYSNPILKPQAAEIVRKHGEISLASQGYPTPSNQCWPGGVPYVFWDFIVMLIQQPDQITLVYRHGNEVRRVRLNERHPAQLTLSWYGDSVGRYDGDTLIVDTVGVKVGPVAMVDMYGTPHTSALHVVERYRMLDYAEATDAVERNMKENSSASGGAVYDRNHRGKMLQLHFTVEDEGVFTTPWTATITYWPQLAEWPELICAENIQEHYTGQRTSLPYAERPDF